MILINFMILIQLIIKFSVGKTYAIIKFRGKNNAACKQQLAACVNDSIGGVPSMRHVSMMSAKTAKTLKNNGFRS